jgi:D-sedoheptulose 7-phosphate isomerase
VVQKQESLVELQPAYDDVVTGLLSERHAMLGAALTQLRLHAASLSALAAILVDTLRAGHKVLVAGNGGSAAEAQHFAAELVGRFKRDRSAYAALALTTDSSILTAVGNDYGYEHVFARQVFALGQPGDLFLAFSTSGESENLVRAAIAARERHMKVAAVTGERPSRLERLADLAVHAPVIDTAIAQEIHMIVTHVLCTIAEAELDDGGVRE